VFATANQDVNPWYHPHGNCQVSKDLKKKKTGSFPSQARPPRHLRALIENRGTGEQTRNAIMNKQSSHRNVLYKVVKK